MVISLHVSPVADHIICVTPLNTINRILDNEEEGLLDICYSHPRTHLRTKLLINSI